MLCTIHQGLMENHIEHRSLTLCGLLMLYGGIDMGQHWLRCLMAPSYYLN